MSNDKRLTVGDRVELLRSNPYFPVRTGTVTDVIRRGFHPDPDVVRVWWNELGHEHNEPSTVLKAIEAEHFSTFDINLHAGYAMSGSDIPPVIMLRHLFEVHYRVIAAHNNSALAGGDVYQASTALCKSLLPLVYKGFDVDDVWDLMIDSGEVLSYDTVAEALERKGWF